MKAITYRQYGDASVLKLEEVEKPIQKSNQLLINVKAVEVTKSDCELRSFNFPVKWFWLPLRLALGVFKPRNPILGGYFAGDVIEEDDNSTFKVGDRLFGSCGIGMGAYGEYLAVNASSTMTRIPQNISYEQAAATPLGALNALHFMNYANIKAGESVLIIGAGGSIGLFAVQIAIARGAVVSVVDKTSKKEMFASLDITDFIDYQQQDIYLQAKRYDVVFNMVAGGSYSKNLNLLKPSGRYIMGNPKLRDMIRSIITPRISQKDVLFAFAKESVSELDTIANMMEEKLIAPIIDDVLPMTAISDAHERVEQERRNGAIVVRIG